MFGKDTTKRFSCQAKSQAVTPQSRNFGDPAGILDKLYSGNLSTESTWAASPRNPLCIGMVMIAHKILTIRLIKLWKYSCRIDTFFVSELRGYVNHQDLVD
jgi:hypothetical protein